MFSANRDFFVRPSWALRAAQADCNRYTRWSCWESGPEADACVRKWMDFHNNKRPHTVLGGEQPDMIFWKQNETTNTGSMNSIFHARYLPENGAYLSCFMSAQAFKSFNYHSLSNRMVTSARKLLPGFHLAMRRLHTHTDDGFSVGKFFFVPMSSQAINLGDSEICVNRTYIGHTIYATLRVGAN